MKPAPCRRRQSQSGQRQSTRRAAVTLIEVLVSIFIMGIGLLALLTLFPLGALTMDEAIRADRAAACARSAYGTVAARNLRKDPLLLDPGATPPVDVFTNPNPNPVPTPPTWPIISKLPGAHRGPTYPVCVDPFGMLAAARPLGAAPAVGSPGIPRRSVSFVAGAGSPAAQNQQALRWFSLLDDMDFDANGLPRAPGGQVQRTNRYTWSLMMRRVAAEEHEWVEMAVVVYAGRPLQLGGGEPAYGPVVFDPSRTTVRVEWDPATQQRPPVRRGGWVLDATVLNAAGQPEPHGYFYRVISVTEVPATTPALQAVQLDLETRPRAAASQGVLVVMEHVIEVFDEGLGWKP